jgi:hypothetical protein
VNSIILGVQSGEGGGGGKTDNISSSDEILKNLAGCRLINQKCNTHIQAAINMCHLEHRK